MKKSFIKIICLLLSVMLITSFVSCGGDTAENKVIINKEITIFALNKLHIDECGLDYIDRKYLDGLINVFNGGPVGLETLALTISEEAVTLEDVSEPFLLQEGFIVRTSRGRVATDKAYEHLGIKRGGLFWK